MKSRPCFWYKIGQTTYCVRWKPKGRPAATLRSFSGDTPKEVMWKNGTLTDLPGQSLFVSCGTTAGVRLWHLGLRSSSSFPPLLWDTHFLLCDFPVPPTRARRAYFLISLRWGWVRGMSRCRDIKCSWVILLATTAVLQWDHTKGGRGSDLPRKELVCSSNICICPILNTGSLLTSWFKGLENKTDNVDAFCSIHLSSCNQLNMWNIPHMVISVMELPLLEIKDTMVSVS